MVFITCTTCGWYGCTCRTDACVEDAIDSTRGSKLPLLVIVQQMGQNWITFSLDRSSPSLHHSWKQTVLELSQTFL